LAEPQDISPSDTPQAGEDLDQIGTVMPHGFASARKRPAAVRPCRMLLANRIDRQFPLMRSS
jgi:hypothetical protein